MSKFVLSVALLAATTAVAPSFAQYAPPPYGQAWGPGHPTVRLNQYDGGTVNLRNGCIVVFNSYGTAISRSARCTARMVRDARDVFRAYQLGRPVGGPGWARPQVGWWGQAVRVDFPGVGCSYVYSRNGEHLQTIGNRCTADMRAIANDAQTAFRRSGRW